MSHQAQIPDRYRQEIEDAQFAADVIAVANDMYHQWLKNKEGLVIQKPVRVTYTIHDENTAKYKAADFHQLVNKRFKELQRLHNESLVFNKEKIEQRIAQLQEQDENSHEWLRPEFLADEVASSAEQKVVTFAELNAMVASWGNPNERTKAAIITGDAMQPKEQLKMERPEWMSYEEWVTQGKMLESMAKGEHNHLRSEAAIKKINYTIDEYKKWGVIKNAKDISDGYHTFGELYEMRAALTRALFRYIDLVARERWKRGELFQPPIWRAKLHADATMFDGMFIVGTSTASGLQITFHYHLDKWYDFNFAETLERAPEWDGHTSADVIERLKQL